ncbi:hypothetical protein CK203_021265 [Vitis vinifera]|uniref:TRF2/HOY1 PH-like domain-containing protein n=1 Tax=Vitis vinifera TaxID=29760 RepID=A0A438IM48_VITVI|nr:hypothetical protein CK203_021265 [Vitis vinifera]
MAGEDRWFNGRLPPAPPEGGGDNNGVFGDPNIPLSGFSHPVSGFQSSGSGFSSTFSGQTNNFGSYSGLPNSFSTFSGDTSHGVAFKRIKLADSNYQPTGHHPVFQEGVGNMVENPNPLGLTLRKTSSLLNLIETSLAKKKRTYSELNQGSDYLNQYRIQPKRHDFVLPQSSEKLKATNFPALLLQIGSWVRESRYEGHLIAKCYYSKRKLVWEILEGSLKKKIEIQWSDISALRTICIENDPTILELELKNQPQYFGETNPQPRKHTLWQRIPDFTGGQAPVYRRHLLKFPPGVLGKQFEKLLQCDNRLYTLSLEPFPNFSYPFFPPSNNNELNFTPAQPLQTFKQTSVQPAGSWDSTSPMSVMEFSPIDEAGNNHGAKKPKAAFWGQGVSMVTGNTVSGFSGRGEVQGIPYIVPAIQANQDYGLQDCQAPNHSQNEELGGLDGRDPFMRNADEHLLDDTQAACSDEETLLAKVRSMGSLIQPEQQVQPADGNNRNEMGFGEDINQAEEPVQPAAEMEFGGEILADQNPLEKSDNERELNMTNEQFLLLSEMQYAPELLASPQFVSQTTNTDFGQEIVPAHELLANPQFVSQNTNMEFRQETVPRHHFPVFIENQQPNFQTVHWVPRPQFPNHLVLSQEKQLILNAPPPQVLGENQMMHFEGNNNLIASQFLNGNELMQHNCSRPSYPYNFPGTEGDNFGNINGGNQYWG